MTAISIQIRPIHAASYIMQSGKHIFGRVSIRIIFAYLKNLKKKELNECSFEELEEKGQFQKQFAVDEVENILMWEAIRNYISLLYPRECEVIICLFIHRMTARETASKLGLSEKTVSYYKMTALKKICKALEDTNQ